MSIPPVPERFFASDNAATVHPRIMEALTAANHGHAISYGEDPITRSAIAAFKELLGPRAEPFFVYNGTAANVLGLEAALRPYNGIICTTVAHINEDECGAPERHVGAKLLAVYASDGRLSVGQIEHFLADQGNEHRSQPGMVSITQATEVGTVYSPAQIAEIASFCHDHGMYLHMDGARIANATVALDRDPREITVDAGVDVLSFGGTKNGLMFGEAVVFFRPELATQFRYIRKQGMQLASKMRYIAAQFDAYIREGLWRDNAAHANAMAKRLAAGIRSLPGVSIAYPVEANGVFARVPSRIVEPLRALHHFYDWEKEPAGSAAGSSTVARWMASFDTTEQDVDRFVVDLTRLLDEAENVSAPRAGQ
ncbi:MAG TPA: low specificity L-threonine aldolase [Spirochaetia bacterium]|nr:low specificity L-threonine aldolase [Spirochaetia bacterium]